MYTIEESIKKIEENIIEEKKQISLLEDYNEGNFIFNEKNYHKLCETPLRGSKELGIKFEKIFPFLKLTDQKTYLNEYSFSLEINGKNYDVFIPNSAIKRISIVIPKPHNTDNFELETIDKKLKEINNAIEAKTIIDRANFVATHYKKPFRILAYIIQYKNKKNYIKRLIEIKEDLEKRKNSAEKRIEKIKIENQEYNETIKYFKENFVPQLLRWTNEVIIENDRNWYSNKEYIKR